VDSKFPKSYLLPIRGYFWHKNKIKRIRRGFYRGNNFQDSKKQNKLKEKNIMGCLPKALSL
jgi:hypothetical protein